VNRQVLVIPLLKACNVYVPGKFATLEGAFVSDRDLEGRSVLLLDDLFQSGATMNVAARTLKRQGLVKSVYALALTRTRN
jgi:predicted amidophosphoribosyltransferase